MSNLAELLLYRVIIYRLTPFSQDIIIVDYGDNTVQYYNQEPRKLWAQIKYITPRFYITIMILIPFSSENSVLLSSLSPSLLH